MEFTRNHYLIAGILLLLAGVQFRYVTSFVLNEKTSHFVDERLGAQPVIQQRSLLAFTSAPVLSSRRVVHPPRWLGFSLLSIGGVLFLFSLTMRKPGS